MQVGDVVRTPRGTITAEHTIVATHYPFPDRSLAFARAHPQRSYAIACRIAGTPPEAMFLGTDSPTRSIRAVPVAGEELLLIGGEGHRPGTGGDTEERYAALEAFAREHWDVRSVEYRWSAQDPVTIDLLPLVGPMTPFEDRVLMATGFGKWGLTGGTAAALLLADLVLGRDNPYADLYNPNRLNLRCLREFVGEGERPGRGTSGRRPAPPSRRPRARGPPAWRGRASCAIGARRSPGTATSTGSCSRFRRHAPTWGCQVNWNRAERSWDCPCHGSRFAPDGTVLEGPATYRLEVRPAGRG